MLRRLKREVMSQLPAKRRQVVRLPRPRASDWPPAGGHACDGCRHRLLKYKLMSESKRRLEMAAIRRVLKHLLAVSKVLPSVSWCVS